MAKSEQPRCVLVTRFSALGDVAIAVPVLYDVCRTYPGTHFVFVTRERAATMMVNTPENLTVVPANLTTEYHGLWGIVRLTRKLLRDYPIDALADLHSVLRTWVMGAIMRLHGVTVKRIDKGHSQKRALTSGKMHRQLKSSHERYRDVLAQLGLPTEPRFTSIFDHRPASSIHGKKAPGECWIAIAPFSQHQGKVYPYDKLRQVFNTLAQRPNTHIFLMGGGEKEKQLLAPWAQAYDNATSVAHIRHTIGDELSLLANCDVMVSMDSANMHLASLVGLPVVSVWGATHPYCGFMGYGQEEAHAVQLDLPCRPCSVFGQKKCELGDYRCLTGITPEMIVIQVDKVLKTFPRCQ